MTAALRTRAASAALMAALWVAPRGAQATGDELSPEGDGLASREAGPETAGAPETTGKPPSDTFPLSLLVQGDLRLGAEPASDRDPQDPPAGAALRIRRARVGEDVTRGDFRLRLLFEAATETAGGDAFPPLDGGRLPFGGRVRTTEAYLAWAPYRTLQIAAGSLRVPFSLTRQVDEADLRLLERAAFADAFLPDFRAGLALLGDLGELSYHLAVMSADRTWDSQLLDRGVVMAGRLVAEPLGPVGLVPWRRGGGDPWYDWFRFAAGVSVLYGSLAAPRTLAVDPEFTAQWRSFVVTAEYLLAVHYAPGFTLAPGGSQQGAVLEPGLTLGGRRIDLVARCDWERAASANSWGVGAGITAYGPDPRLRLGAGFERRWGASSTAASDGGSYWAIARVMIVVD